MNGWEIDFRRLYGWWAWRQRGRFALKEEVFESPAGGVCVVFYHIGEIGVGKVVGRVAVFKDKRAPRKVYDGGWTNYWHHDDAVRWTRDGAGVFIYECRETTDFWGGKPARLDSYLTVLDVERERYARYDKRIDQMGAEPTEIDPGLDWTAFRSFW